MLLEYNTSQYKIAILLLNLILNSILEDIICGPTYINLEFYDKALDRHILENRVTRLNMSSRDIEIREIIYNVYVNTLKNILNQLRRSVSPILNREENLESKTEEFLKLLASILTKYTKDNARDPKYYSFIEVFMSLTKFDSLYHLVNESYKMLIDTAMVRNILLHVSMKPYYTACCKGEKSTINEEEQPAIILRSWTNKFPWYSVLQVLADIKANILSNLYRKIDRFLNSVRNIDSRHLSKVPGEFFKLLGKIGSMRKEESAEIIFTLIDLLEKSSRATDERQVIEEMKQVLLKLGVTGWCEELVWSFKLLLDCLWEYVRIIASPAYGMKRMGEYICSDNALELFTSMILLYLGYPPIVNFYVENKTKGDVDCQVFMPYHIPYGSKIKIGFTPLIFEVKNKDINTPIPKDLEEQVSSLLEYAKEVFSDDYKVVVVCHLMGDKYYLSESVEEEKVYLINVKLLCYPNFLNAILHRIVQE